MSAHTVTKISSPKVFIIILNWNGLTDTIECLESLQKITYPNYNVVLVDNASAGNDVAVLGERFGDYLHIIQNDQNYGFAKGNNIGIRYALDKGADYVLLLNNDTVVDPGFLDELIKVAEADGRIGILCPHMYAYDQPDRLVFTGPAQVDFWRNGPRRHPTFDRRGPVIRTEIAQGAAMLITRKTTETIGLLPEEYFFGVEDLDYSVHASRAGIGIAVITTAKIWHKLSRSGNKLNAALVRHQYRGWQIMRRKYLSPGRYFLSTATSVFWATKRLSVQLLRDVVHGNFHEVGASFSMMGQAIKGLLWHTPSGK
jgi:hypothetical protein